MALGMVVRLCGWRFRSFSDPGLDPGSQQPLFDDLGSGGISVFQTTQPGSSSLELDPRVEAGVSAIILKCSPAWG